MSRVLELKTDNSSSRLQIRVPRNEFLLSRPVEIDRQPRLVSRALLREDHAVAVSRMPDPPAAFEGRRLFLLRLRFERFFEDPGVERPALLPYLQGLGRDLVQEPGGVAHLHLPVDEAAAGCRQ